VHPGAAGESGRPEDTQKVWTVPARYDDVVALADHLRCQGIARVVVESTSAYWRIWFYLLEAAGLQVWLVNAPELPGCGEYLAAHATVGFPTRTGEAPAVGVASRRVGCHNRSMISSGKGARRPSR
jgi:hypothetical protein